ncbi:MAG: hypothetical protein LBI87_13830 [Candidatus Accumulibacter sp.]|jgi:hypothetical protein|nr:hypothetical protein [Accumulibacter sp.]
MKPYSPIARAFFLSLAFCCAAALGQGVYVTRGQNGPVFSDKPRPGAKELTPRPLTVIPAPPDSAPVKGAGAKPAAREPPEAVPPYRSLMVVRPEDGGSVAGDTSRLEIRLAADPPLRPGEGHAFVVRVDERLVDQRFTTPEFVIPQEFWPEGFLPSNRYLRLDAAIVDGNGQVVMRAPPVSFRSRQVLLRPPGYPVNPWLRPKPQPKAQAHPAPPPKKPGKQTRRDEAPRTPLPGKN